MISYRTALAARVQREELAAGVIAAEPIRFKDAMFRLGVSGETLSNWIRIGHLETVNDGARRLIVLRSVRIIAPVPEEQRRLPELHRLIDQIRPRYPADTIGGLLLIVAVAEARLARSTR